MGNVLFSIVIPVWNVEKYIEECLDSVLSQTVKEIEVICVDDCSEDNSLAILHRYAEEDERVKVIELKKNMSSSIARKRGVEAAKGKYIMFADADDKIENNCFETLQELLKEHPVDILHFGTNIINVNNLPKQRITTLQEFMEPYDGYLYDEDVFVACFRDGKYRFSMWNKVYSAELCKKAFLKVKEKKFFRGQDKYAYFILSYYAKSYYGVKGCRLYNYYYGNGGSGQRYISLEYFERYCTMGKVAQAMKEFLVAENRLEQYKDTYEKSKRELLMDCVNQWRNHLASEDKAVGFEIMHRY
ncbi:MAG: glycosyltransferase family 2 protein, partial [Lachnospiraceae bacterium]|nr:glycosyltransferase family 2 protein [Lachnospiraceae bacterium]